MFLANRQEGRFKASDIEQYEFDFRMFQSRHKEKGEINLHICYQILSCFIVYLKLLTRLCF